MVFSTSGTPPFFWPCQMRCGGLVPNYLIVLAEYDTIFSVDTEMRDVAVAKIASAFCDPPGMGALIEFQRKMETAYPFLMKQLEANKLLLHQLSNSMVSFQSEQSMALNKVSTLAQTFSVEMDQSFSWIDTFKSSLNFSPVMGLALEEQVTQSLAASISKLYSALSAYVSEYAAISEAMEGGSLALQKEYAVERACALANSVSSLIDEEEETPDDLPAKLSDEDKHILAEEMSSVLTSKKNWEQRLMVSVTKLKETHPILATLFYGIIINILTSIIMTLAAMAIGQIRTPAKVYEKPQTTSQVVYHLEPLQEVKIIGEQPYYFQIELTDNDTKETLIGFVSKRSVQPVDAQDKLPASDEAD